jgi:GINS complex subunit 3
MSEMMTKAFKGRVVELVDQAQHFAAIGPGGAGGSGSDVAASFREGLDATERESECVTLLLMHFLTGIPVFTLAQASAKRMKKWHEESDKAKQ